MSIDPYSFKCPDCGAVSFNPNDAKNRYCSVCKRFFSSNSTVSPKSNAELMIDLWETTKDYLIGAYPPCKSIDGHGMRGYCDCNVNEENKRRDKVLYILGQLDQRKKEWKVEHYNDWCFVCNQQVYFCRCRKP